MRNLFLSAALIALPAFGFVLIERHATPPATVVVVSGLGDLSAYLAIVDDTRAIAAKGDLAAAAKRITDLESLWDQNADALQAKDATAWGVIDGANDAVFQSLRAAAPDAAKVDAALAALQEALKGTATAAGGGVQMVKGIAVSDANGHPLPCESMAKMVAAALATKSTPEAVALQAKALERCNADDDAHSDAFSAEALALLQG
jgi:hypothetical protein